VKQKVSSRGKYVSVNIGPVQVVSSEQVSLSLSLSLSLSIRRIKIKQISVKFLLSLEGNDMHYFEIHMGRTLV